MIAESFGVKTYTDSQKFQLIYLQVIVWTRIRARNEYKIST